MDVRPDVNACSTPEASSLPTPSEKERLSFDGVVSLLDGFLCSENVTEIVINSPEAIFVKRDNLYHPAKFAFSSPGDYQQYLDLLVERCKRSGGFPYVHSEWRIYGAVDGVFTLSYPGEKGENQARVRVHIALPPLCDCPKVTLCRKRSRQHALTLQDMVKQGAMNEYMANLLEFCVLTHRNIVVSGGTGVGKTTLIQALLGCIPPGERVVIVEEEPELDIPPNLPNAVSLLTVTGTPSLGGEQAHTSFFSLGDLVRQALYMRPTRIIVGEIRTEGALPLVDALSTGHDGSITSVHAPSPVRAVERIINLCLREIGAGVDKSVIGDEVCRVVDFGVHLSIQDGCHVVEQICEIEYLSAAFNRVTAQPLWRWDPTTRAHVHEALRFSDYLELRFRELGVEIPYHKIFPVPPKI